MDIMKGGFFGYAHISKHTNKHYTLHKILKWLVNNPALDHIISVSLFIPSPLYGHIAHISAYYLPIKHTNTKQGGSPITNKPTQ